MTDIKTATTARRVVPSLLAALALLGASCKCCDDKGSSTMTKGDDAMAKGDDAMAKGDDAMAKGDDAMAKGAGAMAKGAGAAMPVRVAVAVIKGQAGSTLDGLATFTESGGKVRLTVMLKGAPPGMHAMHVHQVGDCSAADFASAGAHFNPANHPHGSPTAEKRHAGDLGNLEVQADGTASYEIESPDLTVAAGAHSVVGRSVIIHDKADDFTTQPTGNAGGRIGCGVIAAK